MTKKKEKSEIFNPYHIAESLSHFYSFYILGFPAFLDWRELHRGKLHVSNLIHRVPCEVDAHRLIRGGTVVI